jgi:hypothetical protein
VNRSGNNETAGVAEVERIASPGAAIISAAHPTPWRSDAYLQHRYRTVDDLRRQDLSAAICGPIFYNYGRHDPAGAFVRLIRSSEASLVPQGDSTQRNFNELEEWLKAQDGVELVFSNTDARIYRMTPWAAEKSTPLHCDSRGVGSPRPLSAKGSLVRRHEQRVSGFGSPSR